MLRFRLRYFRVRCVNTERLPRQSLQLGVVRKRARLPMQKTERLEYSVGDAACLVMVQRGRLMVQRRRLIPAACGLLLPACSR